LLTINNDNYLTLLILDQFKTCIRTILLAPFLYFSMMKSTQKSSPNDASARSEKTTEIQAKGAGLQCLSIFTEPFDSARHCALQTSPPLGRVCFAGFPVAFSFTLPPARRSRRPTPPSRCNKGQEGKDLG
jgi:hypothetical protein